MITGASGAIPRDDIKRMNAHAERFYYEIRKRKSDVEAIAYNTGFSVADIQSVKDHIFIAMHELDGRIKRFDPLYDIAVSWQRLIEGHDIQEMDLVLLDHELFEIKLMYEQGMHYSEAHAIAESKYNYASYVRVLDEEAKHE